ncbi:rRNA maturation protein [Thermocladium modestius]|uniref:rRNA maturation protein n=2 Tax=Thermocladium modestius TaxID=62609 RepID=A0A830GTN9_9CREN|nr:rRNA maturation protein [Thermocladium modestius]
MMILITTSRNPSQRTRHFINELIKCIPGSAKLNRGKTPLRLLLGRSVDDTVIQVVERSGNPAAINVYRRGKLEIGMELRGVKLLQDMHVVRHRPASSLVMVGTAWVADALSQALGVQLYPSVDPGELRGVSDAIAVMMRTEYGWRLEFLDGLDLGPCGPAISISGVEAVTL